MFRHLYRYIEIFRSSLSEARAALASIPRGGGGGGGRGGGSHEGRFGGGGDRYGGGRPSPYDRNVDRYGGGPGQMRHGGGHMRRRGKNMVDSLFCHSLDFVYLQHII